MHAKGIATLALLKARYDSGNDHITMFLPFVLDSFRSATEVFTSPEMQSLIEKRHSIEIPLHTLKTLLTRCTHEGYCFREGGAYHKTSKELPCDDLISLRSLAIKQQKQLSDSFEAYCNKINAKIPQGFDYMQAIFDYIDAHHIVLLLNPTNTSTTHHSKKTEFLVALFIKNVVTKDPSLGQVLKEILQGFVLQNALLLKDISLVKSKLNNLEVFLDSNVIISALGYRGEAGESAAKESIELLRSTGAAVSTFEITIEEIKRLLHVYQVHLGSVEGIKTLRQTDVTRHFLKNKYTPSDIKEKISLIETNIRGLRLNIRKMPPREEKYTLDEDLLHQKISRKISNETAGSAEEKRIQHDIDCIAGVLTKRKGLMSDKLESTKAIFSSDSAITISNISSWYFDQVGRRDCISPIIHHHAMTNIAWLKSSIGNGVALNELIASCSSALIPPPKSWEKFVNHLDKLEKDGQINSDEAVAIVCNDLTNSLLMKQSFDDTEEDAISFDEIIERVKEDYKRESSEQINCLESKARKTAKQMRESKKHLRSSCDKAAAVISWILCIVLVVGAVWGFISTKSDDSNMYFNFYNILTFTSLFFGFSIFGFRRKINGKISNMFYSYFSPKSFNGEDRLT